ncbi:MAG: Glu-tRNA(Gln) amidotransferase subunit GatE [Candidatus Undinarchaeales archaeon]
MDYTELGLKVGLEIHQQLNTKKLFCSCPSELAEGKPDLTVKRKLRAVAGETGEIDIAARQAQTKGASYTYHFYNDSCCMVELDEEPPQEIDEEALETVLKVALMFDSKIVDEMHVMRKTVVDGSNTSGFQRTALTAVDGSLNFKGADIGILSICIEEDASRIIERKRDETIYGLDRLGIPLIELATAPDIETPEQAKDVAKAIGSIIRATGKAKRGLGTIRQDLNISIKDGARVEIKGVQDLNSIPDVVNNEIERQQTLLKIKELLTIKNAEKVDDNYTNVSKLFKNTKSKVIKSALKKEDGIVGAIKLKNFSGLLGKEVQPGRRFGSELADYARAYGAGGLFHSDELPAYGITEKEIEKLEKKLKVSTNDAFILIADRKEICEKSFEAVTERVNTAFESVPEETRKALEEGTSSYMRPLAGGARMYPETDLNPVRFEDKYLKDMEKNLPKLPWEEKGELRSKYNLSKEMIEKLYDSVYLSLFKKLTEETELPSKLIAGTFTNIVPSMPDDILLQEKHYLDLFKALENEKFSKEAIPDILEKWHDNPGKNLDEIIDKLDLTRVSDDELEEKIDKIVENKKDFIQVQGERAVKPLMGVAMKELRGKADGKIIMNILKKKIKEVQ